MKKLLLLVVVLLCASCGTVWASPILLLLLCTGSLRPK